MCSRRRASAEVRRQRVRNRAGACWHFRDLTKSSCWVLLSYQSLKRKRRCAIAGRRQSAVEYCERTSLVCAPHIGKAMPRSIITIDDLSNDEMEQVFQLADGFLQAMADPEKPYRIRGREKLADGCILSTLFFEPS